MTFKKLPNLDIRIITFNVRGCVLEREKILNRHQFKNQLQVKEILDAHRNTLKNFTIQLLQG